MHVLDPGWQLRDAQDAHWCERERRKVEAQGNEDYGNRALTTCG